MDFNRPWTIFAVEAEVDHYGVIRIVKAHNEVRAALAELVEDCAADTQQEFGTHDNPNPTTPALERARAVLAKVKMP